MKKRRRRGRLFLLACLGVAVLQAAVVAQPGTPATPAAQTVAPAATPGPVRSGGTVSSAEPVSTAAATPAPKATSTAETSPAPKTAEATPAVETPKAEKSASSAETKEVSASPTPMASPLIRGTLDYSAGAPRDEAGWKQAGAVGQSTFVDKLRTVTWALALICFLVWLVGKFAPKGTLEKFGLPAIESDSLIEVLEKKRMSPGRSILLLRVGPKVLAVAATESGYSTLAEIDGEAVKKHLDERAKQAPAQPSPGPAVSGGPSEVAKHYLSIIPGLGAKK